MAPPLCDLSSCVDVHSRQAKYASLVALALFGLIAVAQAAAPHGRHNSAHLGSPGETEAPKPVTLTKEETKSFLEDTIKAIRAPANQKTLERAKAVAAQDPENVLNVMMQLLPVATNVMKTTLKKYGFPEDQSGLMMSFQAVMAHNDDADIAEQAKAVRAEIIPEALQPLVESMFGGSRN